MLNEYPGDGTFPMLVGGDCRPARALCDPPGKSTDSELPTIPPFLAARHCFCAQLEAAEPSLRPYPHQVRHPRHHGVWLLTANICPRTHPRDDTTRGQGRQILNYHLEVEELNEARMGSISRRAWWPASARNRFSLLLINEKHTIFFC